jgi:hypothetical protein
MLKSPHLFAYRVAKIGYLSHPPSSWLSRLSEVSSAGLQVSLSLPGTIPAGFVLGTHDRDF